MQVLRTGKSFLRWNAAEMAYHNPVDYKFSMRKNDQPSLVVLYEMSHALRKVRLGRVRMYTTEDMDEMPMSP